MTFKLIMDYSQSIVVSVQAIQFNQSSKELFDLMFRLKEAKKRVRERREQEAAAAAAATEAAANTPARELCSYSCTVKK